MQHYFKDKFFSYCVLVVTLGDMMHPKTFLLKRIIGYEENGLNSLGQLNAKHIDDLAKVMQDFTEETIIEVVERLNAGENIKISKMTLGFSEK